MGYVNNKEALAKRNKIDIGFRVSNEQKEAIRKKASDMNKTMNDLIRDTVTSQQLIVAGGSKLRQSIMSKLELLEPILENAIDGRILTLDTQNDLKRIEDIRNAWAS